MSQAGCGALAPRRRAAPSRTGDSEGGSPAGGTPGSSGTGCAGPGGSFTGTEGRSGPGGSPGGPGGTGAGGSSGGIGTCASPAEFALQPEGSALCMRWGFSVLSPQRNSRAALLPWPVMAVAIPWPDQVPNTLPGPGFTAVTGPRPSADRAGNDAAAGELFGAPVGPAGSFLDRCRNGDQRDRGR